MKDLEQAVQDKLDLICAVRANIIHNDEKIEKMLANVAQMDPYTSSGPTNVNRSTAPPAARNTQNAGQRQSQAVKT